MTTIQDVAKAAGVSPMTVSNVINGHPHVRSATRERVLQAMDHLEYRVNIAARNLRAGRTGTIGLAVPEIDRPYFGQFAARLIAIGAEHGYRVVVEQTGRSRENELAAISASRLRMYDGVILSAVSMRTEDEPASSEPHPIVILGEREPHGSVDHVAMDNVGGARLATAHLIERGCCRIAIATGEPTEGTIVASGRNLGYVNALAQAGLTYDPALTVQIPLTSPDAYDAVTRMLAAGIEIDGIFCITDTVAFGAMRAIADRGLSIPGDVKVVGFDNIEEARFSIPRLSSIDPDHDGMARRAMELLLARIENPGANPPSVSIVSTATLVPRESSGTT